MGCFLARRGVVFGLFATRGDLSWLDWAAKLKMHGVAFGKVPSPIESILFEDRHEFDYTTFGAPRCAGLAPRIPLVVEVETDAPTVRAQRAARIAPDMARHEASRPEKYELSKLWIRLDLRKGANNGIFDEPMATYLDVEFSAVGGETI